ncbi:four helix bundle protein [Lewinella lacunae]|uniref:Four helix bundle protein n=2 Tax=Neolewinella lacunae TaxID=1517758 RepID=A0A923PP91_9BACT|nr:four helix bundle protein [Neolewinella lacunae]
MELTAWVEDPKSAYNNSEEKSEFVQNLRQRFKVASLNVINYFEKQPNSPALGVIRYQLLKSATSAAANYRAACRARSKKEFFAKICIVVEETDETLFWLELLRDSDVPTDNAAITTLGKEWQELLLIVAKAKANTNFE